MNLSRYLERVGFKGAPRVDLNTLTQLHRGHVDAIPYENLDVQLGYPMTLSVEAAFDKLVTKRRGGWCYENNGLFAWALEAIGFQVTKVAGAGKREIYGDSVEGTHLVLMVHLDRPYIADVSFGDGLVEPMLFQEGTVRQRFWEYRLEKLDELWWRFHNHANAGSPSYDFIAQPAVPSLLKEKSAFLQTAPQSPFVLNAICQRHFPDRIETLRGRVHKTVQASDASQRLLTDVAEYRAVLQQVFNIDLPEYDIAKLWTRILARDAERVIASGTS